MSGSPKKASKSHRFKTVKKSASTKKAKHPKQVAINPDHEEMDLGMPLHPLRHYLNNRSEFVDQLFLSLAKGNHLENILPDILKDIPHEELKKLCLQQLEVMSKKRIGRILDGKEMESSSGTEDSDGSEAENGGQEKSKQIETETQAADSTSFDLNEPTNPQSIRELNVLSRNKPEDDMLELHADSADDVMLGLADNCAPREIGMVPVARQPVSKVDPSPVVSSQPCPVAVDETAPLLATSSITKTCMELMELELRARAIKSLLKTQATKDAA